MLCVWRTPFGGSVITVHDENDDDDDPAASVYGWTIPGGSDFLTRDLRKVREHIRSGHYQPADDNYTAELLAHEGLKG